ncbi:MAG: biotin--[acetyl-CoA-carboxylase] ligase [Dethiobacter sp.]|jgi:BirA family biotin operon repressor/biotin-[acetyl-CoA-carboxylase] ligase|nr:MAG: biotin--[acetyl-CoA-carboxylase] ligase [Dethiobacter sp.]
MRHKILKLLKDRSPSYLSGEEMAQLLNVSRTSIWKNIHSLQSDGYRIKGSPRLGYRLAGIPDLLFPAEIAGELQTKIIASSPEIIHHYRQIDSTNSALKTLAEKGAPEGTIVIAEEQTGGRGRMGRSWSSPFSKGIWLSILLKPPLAPQDTPLFTLLAAAAVVKGILVNLPDLPVGIKWPNDLLINNRKVCGILTELKAEADLLHYLVIGIGLNVNSKEEDFPAELRNTATSLYLENNKEEVSRQKLASSILQEMDNSYLDYLNNGPGMVISAWKKYNITLGKDVTIKTVQGSFSGKAADLDSDGALIVEEEKGIKKRFQAGEVTLENFTGGQDPF